MDSEMPELENAQNAKSIWRQRTFPPLFSPSLVPVEDGCRTTFFTTPHVCAVG